MAALDTFLVHPDIARIHCQIKARRARTDHYHATLFTHEGRDRKRRLARMFEHHINIIALTGDVPDRLAEFANLAEPFLVFVAVHRCAWQLSQAIGCARRNGSRESGNCGCLVDGF